MAIAVSRWHADGKHVSELADRADFNGRTIPARKET
jgi:hypothetical protein